MSQRLLVITNSLAGSNDEENLNDALTLLREEAWVEVRGTSSPDELSEALADAGDRTIVVAGGDGSMHAVVQCLYDLGDLTGRTLGLLPLGTGNDFARTLEIPRNPKKAARVVLDGLTRPTDLIVDDADRITVNSVHLGAGADAGEQGAKWKKRLGKVGGKVGVGKSALSKLGYPLGALQTAISPPLLRITLEIDGQVVATPDEEVLMVAVGNGASVGGGTPLTPDADPHDGLLDVLIATPVSPLDQLGYLIRLQLGRHEAHAEARIERARTIRVTGEEFDCNSDGEIDGPIRSRSWEVRPGAYTMIVPAE